MGTLAENAINTRQEFENQHDQTVRQEIEIFRVKAAAFLAGEIPENEFRPYRLKHGIYGQRQPGVQMMRCKIPSGLADRRPDRPACPRGRRVRRRQEATSPPARTCSIISCR